MLRCESKTGEVELTFFSTFPEFRVKISDILLLNPVYGTPNDTLLYAPETYASVDIKSLWNDNELNIHKIELIQPLISLYTDSAGNTNYDVIVMENTAEDTTAFSLPFDRLELRDIVLKQAEIAYLDESSGISAGLHGLDLNMDAMMRGAVLGGHYDARADSVIFEMDSVVYLRNQVVDVKGPFSVDIDAMRFETKQAELKVAGIPLDFYALFSVDAVSGDIFTDIRFENIRSEAGPLLALVPDAFTDYLEGMTLSGIADISGSVKGVVNDSLLPHVLVNLLVEDAKFEYDSLPYKIHDIKGNVDLDFDLNDENLWNIRINSFSARTDKSLFSGKGIVDQLMGDMRYDFDLNARLDLEDAAPMLPDDMPLSLDGYLSGSGKLKFLMSQITEMQIDRINFSGEFRATDFSLLYDTIAVKSDDALVKIKMPFPEKKRTSFVHMDVESGELNLLYGKSGQADLMDAKLDFAVSNPMEPDQILRLDGKMEANHAIANMDNLYAYLKDARADLFLRMDMKDSVSLPMFDCSFDMAELKAKMDTVAVDIDAPKGTLAYHPESKRRTKPEVKLIYQSDKLAARMGERTMSTEKVNVSANLRRNVSGQSQNMLAQWIPEGFISMEKGEIKMPGMAAVEIPAIDFDFTPDEFNVKDSRIIIDKSDFRLTGKLSNVKQYVKNEGLLKGVFNFTSDVTDVSYLMNLASGIGYEDTKASSSPAPASSGGPFMVPKGIDLTLNANVEKAFLSTDTATDVRGTLIVKDGVMVLESMLFTASAAKMELTALYKTPLRNHLFAGIDLHLVDINIPELLRMVPDIDTIMPMLRSFDGKGEFHFAVETNLDSAYNIKKSTLLGICSLRGEDLVLMDGETFTEISKMLLFNKKTRNKVDSLSAEFTIIKKSVNIYPFLIVMDKYKAIVSGRHNLDMSFDYHISVVESPIPFRLGVDVKGTMDDMKIRPAKCRYPNMYRPARRNDLENKQLELRRMIRDALTAKSSRQ